MTFHGMGADIQGLGDLHIDGTTGKHLKYLDFPFAQWGGQLTVGFILQPPFHEG